MGRRKKQAEVESEPGAPEWMVTFSDCMTLLLTFFVLMLSFSSFDDKAILMWKMIFERQFSFDEKSTIEKDALAPSKIVQESDESIEKGSEKPTLERGTQENLVKDTEPTDFRNRKIFLISSDKIFYGKGAIISLEGRKILTVLASFLREMPAARIVVNENGQDDAKNKHLGLNRGWAVMEYMTKKQSLDKQQFSIAAASTTKTEVDTEPANDRQKDVENTKAERMLEIVLLERSVYN
jgi:chemotaxis protein MotB